MKICPECSAENADGQKFCSGCGISLQTDLERLLESLGLGMLCSLFEKNDLKTIDDLRLLQDQNFNELGIPYGDKIRIKKALEASVHKEVPVPIVVESPLDRAKTRAMQGDVSAMYEVGEIYSEGSDEVEEDPVEAASWYRKAAEKGHSDGQYRYGDALYYGRGVAEDEKESARWLRLSSRQGHSGAKDSYNARLEEGRFAYLLDSAEQGNADSQYRLGSLFYHGEQGHPVDKAQAASWFRKSAAQGLAAAQYLLGSMYLRGDGIRQDPIDGKRLIEAAAAQGYPEAVELLKTLQAQASSPASPPASATTSTQQQPSSQVEVPKKKGKLVWQAVVGIVFTLFVIVKIVALIIPDEKKTESSSGSQSLGFGAPPSSSTAGIINMGSSTPIPVSRPAAFSQQVPAPFVAATPIQTPAPETVIPQPIPPLVKPPAPIDTSITEKSASKNIQPNLGGCFVNSLGLRFVPIPGTVTYFSIYDTRVSDYQRFVNETGRFWKPAGFPQQSNHPAVRISYYDAVAFCEWLTKKEHASGALPQGCEYRLPTDLEWSAAAGIGMEIEGPPAWRSGGIPNCYAWGSVWPPPPGCGNYDPKLRTDKYPYTSPVGAFAANRFGLYDMNGNVYQWVRDDYDQSGEGCLRGGSWPDEAEDGINLTNRLNLPKDTNFKCFGIRCVVAPIGAESRIATSKFPPQ
jgi:TPR repeat protein